MMLAQRVCKTLYLLALIAGHDTVLAQLSMPVSPVEGTSADLSILVNPGVRSLFAATIRIGACRIQLHGPTVFVYQGNSTTNYIQGDIGDANALSSSACRVELSLSKVFLRNYRLRVELLNERAGTTFPIVAEYSWVKDPYVSFMQTLGDWKVVDAK